MLKVEIRVLGNHSVSCRECRINKSLEIKGVRDLLVVFLFCYAAHWCVCQHHTRVMIALITGNNWIIIGMRGMRSPPRGCARGLLEKVRTHTQVEWQFFGAAAAAENAARYKVFPVRKHTQPLSPSRTLRRFFFVIWNEMRERCEQVGVADCSINQISRYLGEFRVLVRISEKHRRRYLSSRISGGSTK